MPEAEPVMMATLRSSGVEDDAMSNADLGTEGLGFSGKIVYQVQYPLC